MGATGKAESRQRREQISVVDKIQSLMQDTGFDRDKAERLNENLTNYFENLQPENLDYGLIEEGLSKMPVYDGNIYRGMTFAPEEAAFKDFANLKAGDELRMRNISSWTSDEGIATDSFALMSSNKLCSVVIESDNKTGVGVQHLSSLGGLEKEVLHSANSRWKVKDVQVYDTKADAIIGHYKRLAKKWDEELRAGRQTAERVEKAHAAIKSTIERIEKNRGNYEGSGKAVYITVTEKKR